VPGTKDIYACGDYNVNSEATDFTLATYTAALWRGDNMGNVNFYLTVSGTNPLSTAANQDRCMGVSWEEKTQWLTVLLQVKAKEIRYFNKGNFFDTVVMVIDQAGTVQKAVSFSNSDIAYDMYSAN
jgi:hypothetical protein